MCVRVIETKNKEVKVHPQQDPQLLIVNLMRIPDLTNCTRLRLWQPVHAGTTSFIYRYLVHIQ